MGMFDWIDYECICPVCHTKVDGFQSKSGNCDLVLLHPNKVSNFYSSCTKCGCWLEFVKDDDNVCDCVVFDRTVMGGKKGKKVELTEHRKKIKIQEN